MKIAVIGAGAIGSLVAGYLKLKGEDVTLVGRLDSVMAIREHSLRISGVRGEYKIPIDINERVYEKPDLAILAVKTQNLSSAIKINLDLLKDLALSISIAMIPYLYKRIYITMINKGG